MLIKLNVYINYLSLEWCELTILKVIIIIKRIFMKIIQGRD